MLNGLSVLCKSKTDLQKMSNRANKNTQPRKNKSKPQQRIKPKLAN